MQKSIDEYSLEDENFKFNGDEMNLLGDALTIGTNEVNQQ